MEPHGDRHGPAAAARDRGRGDEVVAHGGDAPAAVVAHGHALHAPAAELLADVPEVDRDGRAGADRGGPLLEDTPLRVPVEVIALQPAGQAFADALLARFPVPHRPPEIGKNRCPGADDAPQDRPGGGEERLGAGRENLRNELSGRAFEDLDCYSIRHGETSFGLSKPLF